LKKYSNTPSTIKPKIRVINKISSGVMKSKAGAKENPKIIMAYFHPRRGVAKPTRSAKVIKYN
jgi:hypothetical protein